MIPILRPNWPSSNRKMIWRVPIAFGIQPGCYPRQNQVLVFHLLKGFHHLPLAFRDMQMALRTIDSKLNVSCTTTRLALKGS
jgi:hypothetical protein